MARATSVAEKIVVDIGTYVGDSTIFFATRSAKKVLAIKSYSETYREMLENIKLNNLKGKIIMINARIDSKISIYLKT